MDEISFLLLLFDSLLGLSLLWLAWQALSSPDLFRAIVLFIAYGLLMALVWIRLDAVDVALAEAAIGSGLTGALLLATLARLETKNSNQLSVNKQQVINKSVNNPILFWLILMILILVLVTGLIYAVLTLPENIAGLGGIVAENLNISGVTNPVTAVLLNFRSYDTLLEMSVLLLVLIAVWSLGGIPKQQQLFPGPVLNLLIKLLVPILIIVSGYFLWAGADAHGGAFQAGAILGAAGVLLLLTGWRLSGSFMGLALRSMLILGLGVFIVTGVILIILDGQFLEYPVSHSGLLILLIEVVATLSIGITLAALFLGGRPVDRRRK
ncbi:MAG: DUF4040 domain-containing protein [Proteobacteria bacterium]|nr:DUF4040 domain-containing protein [Pseudomonadota bacterium]